MGKVPFYIVFPLFFVGFASVRSRSTSLTWSNFSSRRSAWSSSACRRRRSRSSTRRGRRAKSSSNFCWPSDL